jgi:O-antigen/teichoic acid export membrane protein
MLDKKSNLSTRSLALQRILDRGGLDQAVVFTLLTRAWQATAGLVSLVLIAQFLSPEVQGFYYTFSSLLALQAFVELGLYVVIVNLVSREWSKLNEVDSAVVGDETALSRLASLIRFICKWYSGVSLLFIVSVGIGGHIFFMQSQSSDVAWIIPWWTVVTLAGAQLWMMPMLSVLEGCNKVVELNRFRLVQTVVEAIAVWILFVAGAELWVVVGSLTIKVSSTLIFLFGRYRLFFRSIFEGAGEATIHWRNDVWPMQWRLAAQGAVNYLAYSLFTPVMFHFHGAKTAGQMGMTLQVISVVHLMASAWVQTKVPVFGMLAARRDYTELDKVWRRASTLSLGFTVAGSLVLWLTVFVLRELDDSLASRMLGPLPMALFLLGYGLLQISNCQSVYLRSHGREPFLIVGVMGGLLIGTFVYVLGSKLGPVGAAASFTAVIALFTIPFGSYIWIRRRKEWQAA